MNILINTVCVRERKVYPVYNRERSLSTAVLMNSILRKARSLPSAVLINSVYKSKKSVSGVILINSIGVRLHIDIPTVPFNLHHVIRVPKLTRGWLLSCISYGLVILLLKRSLAFGRLHAALTT